MTTVSGIIRDTQKAPLAALTVILRRLGPVVGFDGGAIGPDTKTFTTDGNGLLTMPDLATGRYEFDLAVPANPQTSQTVLRRTIGIVPTDAGDTMTLEQFLTESIDNITPTLIQQALDAAALSQAYAESPTPPDPDDATSKSSKTWAGEAADSAALADSEGNATIALNAASAAQTAEAGAVTAQGLAEAARDAAFVNADVYADTAAGLAATVAGDQFQVVAGDEIIRYRHDAGPLAVEVARYPSAAILLRDRMLRQSALDRAEGFEWSLAEWYLADLTRLSTVPWYDVGDMSTLFQDAAGTTPVVAVDDPVRLIKAKNGNAAHDLKILTTGSPGTYKRTGSRGKVQLGSGVGFRTDAGFTFAAPMFAAAQMEWRATGVLTCFGITFSLSGYFHLFASATTQNRPNYRHRANALSGGPALRSVDGELATFPPNAPVVQHAQLRNGTDDGGVNAQGIGGGSNGFTSAITTSTGVRITVGMLGPTASSNVDADFYGGLFFFGDMPMPDRERIVEYLRLKCTRPLAADDFNMLVLGDSTGNAVGESGGGEPAGGEVWFRFAQYLRDEHPTAFVGIRTALATNPVAFRNNGYTGEIVLQDDTGGGAYRIWNGSIPGAQPVGHLGSVWDAIVEPIPRPDVIWINHGYNISANGGTAITRAAQFLNMIEALKEKWPGVPIYMLRQPRLQPNTGDMDGLVAAVDAVAALYGDIETVDVWQRYRDLDDDASLTSDGTHPSPLGVDEYIAAVTAAWEATWPLGQASGGFAGMPANNPITNARFLDWSAGSIVDWTAVGAGTVSREAVLRPDDTPFSLKIADTADQSTYIQQVIDATPYQGGNVTLAVKMYVGENDIETLGRTQLTIIPNGAGAVTSNLPIIAHRTYGRWFWQFTQAAIPADATTITLRLYGRFDGSRPVAVHYSAAVLSAGNEPRTA